MPTFEALPEFWRDYEQLTAAQRDAFMIAIGKFVADLIAGKLRAGLRVRAVQGVANVFERTWAHDGRATFSYGHPVLTNEAHIIWRRCGA